MNAHANPLGQWVALPAHSSTVQGFLSQLASTTQKQADGHIGNVRLSTGVNVYVSLYLC